jgi:hypothetical protein
MNPLAVETALKAALAASAFPSPTTIYTGTNFEEMTPESLHLIVSVDSFSSVGKGLYTAVATVKLTAPALLGSTAYTQFSSALESLKVALTSSYLLTNWPVADAPNFCGSTPCPTTISTAQDSNSWTADLQMTLGVMD